MYLFILLTSIAVLTHSCLRTEITRVNTKIQKKTSEVHYIRKMENGDRYFSFMS